MAPIGSIKIAIIGLGHMGYYHLKKVQSLAAQLGLRIVAVVDPDEDRRLVARQQFEVEVRGPFLLSNIGEFDDLPLEDQPDAVIVAVPANLHVPIAMACLDKGYHCFVEKPLGFSVDDCRELEAKAVKMRKLLQVGMMERWSLGRLWGTWKPDMSLLNMTVIRKGPYMSRTSDTDVVHDLMIHDIDNFVLLSRVFELAPIKTLKAWGKRVRSEHLDEVSVQIELENESYIRFYASRLSAESQRCWELVGANWHATVDFMRRNLKRYEKIEGRSMPKFQAFESLWPGGDPLALELEAFVDRMRGTFKESETSNYLLKPFCGDPTLMIPSARSVMETHKIIDSILGAVKVR